MKKLKKHSYYIKLILSLLVSVFFCVSILTFSFAVIFTGSLQENLYQEYRNGLARSKLAFEHLLAETAQINYTLLADPKVDLFLESDEPDTVMRYHALINVNRLALASSYISSVAICNAKNDSWIENGSTPIDRREMVRRIEPGSKRSLISWNQDGRDYFTAAFSWPDGEGFDYHIFISMNAADVASQVFGERGDPSLILDESGHVILENGASRQLPSSIHSLLTETRDVPKREYALFSLPDDAAGIEYLELHSYSEIMDVSREKVRIFLLIASATFLLFSAAAFLLSRRLYKPVKKVTQLFQRSDYARDRGFYECGNVSEFDMISEVYEKAVMDVRNLSEQNDAYLPRIQADFLRRLLVRGDLTCCTTSELEKKAFEHRIRLDFSRLYIAVLSIDRYTQTSLYMEAIVYDKLKATIGSLLSGDFDMMAIPDNRGNIAVFLSRTGPCDDPLQWELLIEDLKHLCGAVTETCPVFITIAVAEKSEKPEEYPAAYQNALNLLENRFVFGYNQVITPDSAAHLAPDPIVYPQQIMTEIVTSLKLGQKEAYAMNLHSFIETISGYIVNTARLLYTQLSHECIRQLHQVSAGTRELHSDITARILSPVTLSDGETYLLNLFEDYQRQQAEAESLKNDKHYKVIEQAKKYILTEYPNPMLSVDMIADHFGYSPNYFAKLFKNITNSFINDYIKQIRIAKSQELIAETSLSVSEIAEQVGLQNPNYFYVLFKKETGLTPASYREIQNKNRKTPPAG